MRGALIEMLPENPTVFVRNGGGIIGFGEALRLRASGPNRINDLADQWRDTVASALVSDSVNLPGTGLVAFGSIAFADESSAESVLIVPEVIVGARDGRMWLTQIEGSKWPAFKPAPASGMPRAPLRGPTALCCCLKTALLPM
jgi:menaquinone-specific isochorismate synthase